MDIEWKYLLRITKDALLFKTGDIVEGRDPPGNFEHWKYDCLIKHPEYDTRFVMGLRDDEAEVISVKEKCENCDRGLDNGKKCHVCKGRGVIDKKVQKEEPAIEEVENEPVEETSETEPDEPEEDEEEVEEEEESEDTEEVEEEVEDEEEIHNTLIGSILD